MRTRRARRLAIARSAGAGAARVLALAASAARARSTADTARLRRWREDLRFVVDRVATVHPRPFAFSKRAAFASAGGARSSATGATAATARLGEKP